MIHSRSNMTRIRIMSVTVRIKINNKNSIKMYAIIKYKKQRVFTLNISYEQNNYSSKLSSLPECKSEEKWQEANRKTKLSLS